ncbi:MAG TPA: DUF1667 domain-containing protein [Firmicutes bacterium]|nr:DUF1667 domain-containing protein [Bacillota bacterium]
MAEKEMICILCPLGCKMQVKEKEDQPGELRVRGHQCKQGKTYAYEEFHNPTRTLTSTVVIRSAALPRLPVKTDRPIPKDLIFKAAEEIARVEVEAPVELGDMIIKNLLGTGSNIVATRSLKKVL